LNFCLGTDWKKDYVPWQSVCDLLILDIWKKLSNRKAVSICLSYVHGPLVRGTNILGKKRQLSKYFSAAADSNAGAAVTNFDNDTIAVFKQQMRSKTDASMAEKFNYTTKQLLLQESF
jgi:hypothetical protein